MYKVIVSAVFFIVLNNSSNALAKDSTEANYYLNFSYGVAKHSLKEGDPDDKEHFDATTDAFSLNFDYRLSENF